MLNECQNKIKNFAFYKLIFLLGFIVSLNVNTNAYAEGRQTSFSSSTATSREVKSLASFPTSDISLLLPGVQSAIKNRISNGQVDKKWVAIRISQYLSFLGFSTLDVGAKKILLRLLNSSTQFLLCTDLSDWECLEMNPVISPSSVWRRETATDLGAPISVPEDLRLRAYFTNEWDQDISHVDLTKVLAARLAQTIASEQWDHMEMAIYGIDDIKGSMNGVFQSIQNALKSGTKIKAVLDTEGFDKKTDAFPLIFSQVPFIGSAPSIFSFNSAGKRNLAFQYRDTFQLLSLLNEGSMEEQAPARLEWPDGAIMHNKFIVFGKGQDLSVWTGTANISETCMGTERNSNVGIYLENSSIAEAYLEEFNEMHSYREIPYQDPVHLVSRTGGSQLSVGHFQNDKRPNTHRYFQFRNGDEVRVHFSPTDDAEHRVLLPMLLSAGQGDHIRISMFGGGGFEYVRAMQWAAAQGAQIQIVFDNVTGSGLFSWLNNKEANLREKNPYSAHPLGSIQVRLSTWPKLNHHKTATLTHEVNGKEHVEIAMVGSQNWSQSGNDENDENMLTIRNRLKSVEFGLEFNAHFDQRLWPASQDGEVSLALSP